MQTNCTKLGLHDPNHSEWKLTLLWYLRQLSKCTGFKPQLVWGSSMLFSCRLHSLPEHQKPSGKQRSPAVVFDDDDVISPLSDIFDSFRQVIFPISPFHGTRLNGHKNAFAVLRWLTGGSPFSALCKSKALINQRTLQHFGYFYLCYILETSNDRFARVYSHLQHFGKFKW